MAGAGKKRYAMSRRRLNTIWVVCILLATVVVLVDRRAGRSRRQWTEQWGSKAGDAAKYHLKTFTAVYIVDGDTLDIDIPDGEYDRTRVRLLGVDTPETARSDRGAMYYGPQASAFAKSCVEGKQVRIVLAPTKTRGKYGRLLAYVYSADSDTMLNEELITRGFGYADTRFDHVWRTRFLDLEKRLRETESCCKELSERLARSE